MKIARIISRIVCYRECRLCILIYINAFESTFKSQVQKTIVTARYPTLLEINTIINEKGLLLLFCWVLGQNKVVKHLFLHYNSLFYHETDPIYVLLSNIRRLCIPEPSLKWLHPSLYLKVLKIFWLFLLMITEH